jgi:hypothetical protein
MAEAGVEGVKEWADLLTVFALNVATKLLMREEHLAFPLNVPNAERQ